MTASERFGKAIPKLTRVTAVTPEQSAAALSESLVHLFLVGCDATWGLLGSRVPFITISTRTALACLDAQAEHHEGDGPGIRWDQYCPMWALMLGALLETINPGHLQGAMVADFARGQNVVRQISGLK